MPTRTSIMKIFIKRVWIIIIIKNLFSGEYFDDEAGTLPGSFFSHVAQRPRDLRLHAPHLSTNMLPT